MLWCRSGPHHLDFVLFFTSIKTWQLAQTPPVPRFSLHRQGSDVSDSDLFDAAWQVPSSACHAAPGTSSTPAPLLSLVGAPCVAASPLSLPLGAPHCELVAVPGAWSETTPAFRHCRHCPVMAMCLRVQPPRPLCVGLRLGMRADLSWSVPLHLAMTGHNAQFARVDMRCTAWRPTPQALLDSGWGKCRSGFLGFFVTISPQCGGGGPGGCAFTLVAAAWVPVALGVVDRCLLPPGGRLVCGCQAWRNR